ncbi:alpha/beta hydrolase [Rhodococcus sp. MS16]|uniref:alpha/beta hydrolase n=1 Tax=Rhodococcus TaxID=1827 RepID=UPI00156254C6|nr:alpha/beta hydrolase [Rhodococcus globerulus]MCE4267548.1 alpha/beta hydrolase [Rhodococcus globerulus]NRI68716.1 alpha/beta hydrolase [Rhodococcus sp. MS16]
MIPERLLQGLDPDARALLDQRGAPLDYRNLDILEARKAVERRPRAAGEDVASSSDLEVIGVHGVFRVRVLRPVLDVELPAIVYFHGGGLVVGSIDSFDGLARSLAVGCRAVVINVDYYLAPEHAYPVATDQAYEALCWVAEHAAELGIDLGRISVAGDSAGGQLAAGVALQARDCGGPALLAQLLFYPGVDFDWDFPSADIYAEGPILLRSSAEWMKAQYFAGRGPKELSPYAVPVLADDLSNLPDAIVVTAEYDLIRDGCERYAERLRHAGNQVVIARYPGVGHGFITQGLRRSLLAVSDVCALMRSRQNVAVERRVSIALATP